jgi:hypothetical protein
MRNVFFSHSFESASELAVSWTYRQCFGEVALKAATIAAYVAAFTDRGIELHPQLLHLNFHFNFQFIIIMDSFHFSDSLQEFAVSEATYLRQHPGYDCLVTGSIVFNEQGKLLLVQRAAEERAFPDFWVSR